MPLSLPDGLQVTFLGQSTFHIVTPGGKRLLIAPWVEGNPLCPKKNADIGPLDYLLVTHAHQDHMGDIIPIATDSGAQVVANFEIINWLAAKGVKNGISMNTGGTLDLDGMEVTQTPAFHTSTITDGEQTLNGGSPQGFIIRLKNGYTVYDAGDTSVFGDMALLAEMYRPDLAFLPIGDRFTMGPKQAAYACRLLNVPHVVPIHYATFPMLTGTPEAFQSELDKLGVQTNVVVMQPGETIGAAA